jgi:D-3-phosphoglycerate dehydrogenase
MTQTISLSKDKIKLLLLEGLHPNAVNHFNEQGYTHIEYHKTALTGDALKEAIQDAHFIGIRSRTQLTEDVLKNAKKLMAIGCFCIGTNQVDLNAALVRGIPVFNAPFSNTRSVAELVLAQAILLLRRIPEKNALAHRGVWQKTADHAYETRGKTLGIIGYGSIGSQLSILAEHLGMRVIFHDIISKLPLGNAEQVSSLEALLNQSDVVSLHVPETADTQDMMNATRIQQIKKGGILINAARGTVVDIPALAEALTSGHLSGAAVDVFPVEPASNNDPFESPLQGIPNVILTPHIGGSTLEAQANIGLEVSDKFIRYSDNGSTITAVNFPEVGLPAPQKGAHRLLHIHQNVPGVLAEINQIFSKTGINILAQYLQTNDKVGYVVMDVAADSSEQALKELQEIKGTIRTRVLF